MAYDNKNRGAVWDNLGKKTATQPDLKGELNVEGEEYWVSCWQRQQGYKLTAPALSFSITKKTDKPKFSQQENPTEQKFNDDMPF